MVWVVATATDDGSSMLDLWWKSGSTTGGAARSASAVWAISCAKHVGSAGRSGPSKIRGSRLMAWLASPAPLMTFRSTEYSHGRCGRGRRPSACGVISVGDPLAGAARHTGRFVGIVEHVVDGAAEQLRAPGRHEKPGLARHDHVGHRVDRRRDDRNTGLDRLDAARTAVPRTGWPSRRRRTREAAPRTSSRCPSRTSRSVDAAASGRAPASARAAVRRRSRRPRHRRLLDRGKRVDPVLAVPSGSRSGRPCPPGEGRSAARAGDGPGRARPTPDSIWTSSIAGGMVRTRSGNAIRRRIASAATPLPTARKACGIATEPPFDRDVRGAAPRRLEVVEREAVEGVDDPRHPDLRGGRGARAHRPSRCACARRRTRPRRRNDVSVCSAARSLPRRDLRNQTRDRGQP